MLIHVNGTCASAKRITAGGIVPHSACPGCKPHIEGVEKDPVRIVRVHYDSLVIPVLGIVALATSAVSERTTLRAFHVSPARSAIRGSPSSKLTSIGIAATSVVIPNDRLRLCIDIVRIIRRNCDIDAPELIGGAATGAIAATNRI